MKKVTLAVLLMGMSLFGADYSVMTTEELQAMRGSVPVEEREAFQAEMQNRVKAMNTEEREEFTASMKKSKSGPMDGTGNQMQKGSQMQQGGKGQGYKGGNK
jgi:hypothetical protein